MTSNFIKTSPHHFRRFVLCVPIERSTRPSLIRHSGFSSSPTYIEYSILRLSPHSGDRLALELIRSKFDDSGSIILSRAVLGKIEPPDPDRLNRFSICCAPRSRPSPDLRGEPLALTAHYHEKKDLEKLNSLRDDIEHVKPTAWNLEIVGLRAFPEPRLERLVNLTRCRQYKCI